MDKPLCTICDPPRRHWPSEPHRFAPTHATVGSRTVTARKIAETALHNKLVPKPEPTAVLHNKMRESALIARPGVCPYCDHRRAYAADAMRRKRSKDKDQAE